MANFRYSPVARVVVLNELLRKETLTAERIIALLRGVSPKFTVVGTDFDGLSQQDLRAAFRSSIERIEKLREQIAEAQRQCVLFESEDEECL